MSSRFIHIVINSRISSFLSLNNISLCILFINSSVNGHLCCFHILAIGNNALIDIGVKISLSDPEFNYFGQISRSGVARSYDSIIFLYILGTSILFSMKSAPFYIPLNLNILKNINQVFWKISFSLAMPDIYSWLDWCYRFLEQYQRTEVPFSSHYIKRYVILTWPIPGGVSFDNLVKAALVSFSNVKFAIFLNQISSILSICISKFKIFYFNNKCF